MQLRQDCFCHIQGAVLSFCLANAPSQVARIMKLVMSGLTYDVCLVFPDNILIFPGTFDEDLERLATVFNKLDRYSLKLKPSKCTNVVFSSARFLF